MAAIFWRAFKPIGIFFGDESRRYVAAFKPFVVIDRLQERDVVADPVQLEIIQRDLHRAQRYATILAPCAELGDHGVVEHGDLAALKYARVVADNRALIRRAFYGRAVAFQASDGGQEITIRVFGVNPRLQSPAVNADVFLFEIELLALRRADHLLDQIHARN